MRGLPLDVVQPKAWSRTCCPCIPQGFPHPNHLFSMDSYEPPRSTREAAAMAFPERERLAKLPCKNMLTSQNLNLDFVGRVQVLQKLHEALKPPEWQPLCNRHASLRSLALGGPAGIGKTQIALQYAYSNMDQFDAIFWVEARSADKLADGFRDIAMELQLINPADASDSAVTTDAVLHWLWMPVRIPGNLDQEREDATWLLIFNDADTPELLDDYWPSEGDGSILVTTRSPSTSSFLRINSVSVIELQPFKHEEAVLLLQKLICNNSDRHDETALALCDRLGAYPHALMHVAAIIRHKNLTIGEVLGQFNRANLYSDIYECGRNPFADKYAHTISTVWASENLGDAALHLLDVLAFLDPDSIPESIVQTVVDQYTLDGADDKPGLYEKVRTGLISASLIQTYEDKKQLSIHRVVQEGTRNRMSLNKMERVFSLVVESLLKAWDNDPEERFTDQEALWDVVKLISPHVTHITAVFCREGLVLNSDTSFAFARLLQENGWLVAPCSQVSFPLTCPGIFSSPAVWNLQGINWRLL